MQKAYVITWSKTYVCSCVRDKSRLFISSFLAGGLAGQGLRSVTFCGDRAVECSNVTCGEVQILHYHGEPSAEIARVECSNVW